MMRALRIAGIERLELENVAVPLPAADQVLIRTGATTICTSDLHDLHENPFGIRFPMTLGHEGSGVVVARGTDVRGIDVGARVAAHPVHPCGQCPTCTAGMPHLCQRMGHFGLNMPGTFAEYFVARADRVRRIPDAVSVEVAALMEPVCVCLEALHQARHGPGRRLLIIGDGPFGVIMARLAARAPGSTVVVAGHHDGRLAFAAPALTVNVRQAPDALNAVCDAIEGPGFDAVIVAVAQRDAFRLACDAVRAMGRVVVFAPMPGETPVDLFDVLRRELEIVGAVNDQDRLDDAVQALADPLLRLGDLITRRFALDDYRHAFQAAESERHSTMKVAFVPGEPGVDIRESWEHR